MKGLRAGAKVVAVADRVSEVGNLTSLAGKGDDAARASRNVLGHLDDVARAADEPVVLARGPRSHLNGAIAEAHGYDEALNSGHVGIKKPGKVTSQGPDFITLDTEGKSIFVWDSKYRRPSGSYPSAVSQAKLQAWGPKIRSAIDAIPPGLNKEMALEAFRVGSIIGQVFRWPK